MSTALKVFQLLQHHTWNLSRTITGATHNATGKGTATFAARDNSLELDYTENLTLTFPDGQVTDANQVYRYVLSEEKLSVYFVDDNRLFHQIKLPEAASTTEDITGHGQHDCNPDRYTTTYFFKKDSFSIEHVVSGPEKDYKTTTEYTPIAEFKL